MSAPVVAEALSWCGTPFHPAAAVKGAGCDCYGLLIGVWEAVTRQKAPPLPCVYQPERTILRRVQTEMLAHLHGLATPIPVAATDVGDVLLFAPDRTTIVHCGLLTSPDRFVHSLSEGGAGRVQETRLSARWQAWHVETYRFKTEGTQHGQYSSCHWRVGAGGRFGPEHDRGDLAGEPWQLCRESD
jgi:NlpC/P60 family putative phage cell wall peptidase